MAIAAAPGCGFNSNTAKPGPDAGVDAPGGPGDDGGPPPDGPPTGNGFCYGPSGWQVCLDARASGQIVIPGTLDTDKSKLCLDALPASWTANQPAACIVAGDTVMMNVASVTGSRPLVIVAQTEITVTVLLDVASRRFNGNVGAGAAASDCKPFVTNPDAPPGGGGGAGGSFMFPGANGSAGNGVFHVGGQAASANVGVPSRLQSGCPGQVGGGGQVASGAKPSDGGAGGGAVYLVSAGRISIPGKIDASGAGGGGGDVAIGGGGGGSGGMIVLFGASITTTSASVLVANGGGGGGGGSAVTTKGMNGQDPDVMTPTVAASGGLGGIELSANGADGGRGYALPIAATMGPNADTGAGGGGGGGAGGYIRSNVALGMAVVSPAMDLKP